MNVFAVAGAHFRVLQKYRVRGTHLHAGHLMDAMPIRFASVLPVLFPVFLDTLHAESQPVCSADVAVRDGAQYGWRGSEGAASHRLSDARDALPRQEWTVVREQRVSVYQIVGRDAVSRCR